MQSRLRMYCLRSAAELERVGVQLPGEMEAVFVHPVTTERLREVVPLADFLLVPAYGVRFDGELLGSARRCRLLQLTGTGFEGVDLVAARRAGIDVANSPGLNSTAVAEWVFLAAGTLLRGLGAADWGLKAGRYAEVRAELTQFGPRSFHGLSIGVVGLGRIGQHVATIARCLGAEAQYFDAQRLSPERERELGVRFVSLEDLLHSSDVITLHVPLSPETRNLIGPTELARLKPDAILVNASRGGVVDEPALAEALAAGRLGGAAIDTFDGEALPPEHPLLGLPAEVRDRVLLSPHVAGGTMRELRRMWQFAVDNIVRVARGEPPYCVVNG